MNPKTGITPFKRSRHNGGLSNKELKENESDIKRVESKRCIWHEMFLFL